jgi:hypothetical protein
MHYRFWPYKKLREEKDSVRLLFSRGGSVGCVVLYLILVSHVRKRRGYAMPIELLVPIVIFVLGIVVSVSLSSLGIECITEGNKK